MSTEQKSALEFYANPRNYTETIKCGTVMCSPVEIDGGAWARAALDSRPYGPDGDAKWSGPYGP